LSAWALQTSTQFDKAIRKLDRPVVVRIVGFLDDLAELDDPRSRGRGLSGQLAGLWRYRIGDYRLLVRIEDAELVIVALDVAHRRDDYEDQS
jgi:mRNA interferase RelE/StbE